MYIAGPLDDSFCDQGDPTGVYESNPLIRLERTLINHKRFFMFWDLRSLFNKKVRKVSRARLRIYLTASSGHTGSATVVRCIQPIVFSALNWNEYRSGSAWDGAGIEDAVNYDLTYAVSFSLPDTFDHFVVVDITDLVNDALANYTGGLRICVYPAAGDATEWWNFVSGEGIRGERPRIYYDAAEGYTTAAATGQVHPTSGW